MKPIKDAAAPIYFGESAYAILTDYCNKQKFSAIVILVDQNTAQACLPYFLSHMEFAQQPLVITVPAGEEHKSMSTCMNVIDQLSSTHLDRKGLMINLGGGVITDMGGFIASVYKRGMQYINVPTTLLAMVDASVGGKTGVDLGALKNQIGVINNGGMVIVDPHYLKTLIQRELNSGMAEIIKHGLISDQAYWEQILQTNPKNIAELEALIHESVVFKNKIVTADPNEQGIRKILNYGHTLGHAIETYCLETQEKPTLLHGEAIIIGLILETYISVQRFGFPKETLSELCKYVKPHYPVVSFSCEDIIHIEQLMIYDKKNVGGQINFVLLSGIGEHKLNVQVNSTLIAEAFDYYQSY